MTPISYIPRSGNKSSSPTWNWNSRHRASASLKWGYVLFKMKSRMEDDLSWTRGTAAWAATAHCRAVEGCSWHWNVFLLGTAHLCSQVTASPRWFTASPRSSMPGVPTPANPILLGLRMLLFKLSTSVCESAQGYLKVCKRMGQQEEAGPSVNYANFRWSLPIIHQAKQCD